MGQVQQPEEMVAKNDLSSYTSPPIASRGIESPGVGSRDLEAESSPVASPFVDSRGLGSDDGEGIGGSADSDMDGMTNTPPNSAIAVTPPNSTMSRTLDPEPMASHGDIYMSSDDE